MKTFLQILILFVSVSIFGQTSHKFGYQAVVRDALNGLLPNHDLKVRASILIGSNAVYSEVHLPKTNDNGLFNLQVGGGAAESGNFNNIDWSQGNLFLKIETDILNGWGYSIVSNTELLNVPFANYADKARELSNPAATISGLYKGIYNSSLPSNIYYMIIQYLSPKKIKCHIFYSQNISTGASSQDIISMIGDVENVNNYSAKNIWFNVVLTSNVNPTWIPSQLQPNVFEGSKITFFGSNGSSVIFDKIE